MSRIAKKPINIPSGVELKIEGSKVTAKGAKGTLTKTIHSSVEVEQQDNAVTTSPKNNAKNNWKHAGTASAIVRRMVTGVSEGFTVRLVLKGVGYRAKASGNKLTLTLGKSHEDVYSLPEGINAATPEPVVIELSGVDYEVLKQVAAEVREFRKPECYKGKGIRYEGEYVKIKETKKK